MEENKVAIDKELQERRVRVLEYCGKDSCRDSIQNALTEGRKQGLAELKSERLAWLRSIATLIVVWSESGDGRSRVYEVNSCYPGGAGRDGSLVCHVKEPK